MWHNTTLDVLFENKNFFFLVKLLVTFIQSSGKLCKHEHTKNVSHLQRCQRKSWFFFFVLSASVRACFENKHNAWWAKQYSYGCNIMNSASSCLQMCSFIAMSKRLWLSWLLICPTYTEWLSCPFNSGHQAAEDISSSSQEWKQICLCGTISHQKEAI